ncbi:gypsy-16 si, partial [Scomber scombrus]
MVQRIVFRQRGQRPGESVHHYVTDLWCLASLCKFGNLEEEMIRDQLAEHTTDPKLWEKLFMSLDDLPLSRAVVMALQLESAALLASRLAASDPAPSQSAPLAQTVALTAQLSEPTSPQDNLE